ncbi:MAG: hypothetical protein V1494_05815 [Candidatus Diapherotrites archaeon]
MKVKPLVFALLIVLLFLAGCTSETNTNDSQNANANTATPAAKNVATTDELIPSETSPITNNAEVGFRGDISDLLPTREEVNSEYKKEAQENESYNIEGFFPNYQSQGLKTTGFVEGAVNDWYISEGSTITDGYIYLLKFDSVQNTKTFFDNLVLMIKNEGGYKEKKIFSIDAECFGLEGGDFYAGYYVDYYCIKKNVLFNTEVITWKKSRFGDAETWAKSIAKKI